MAMVTWTVRGILTGIMGLLACQGASAWYSSKEDNIAGIYSVGGQARWAVSWRNAGGQTMPFLTDILTGEVRLLVSDGDRYLAGSSLRPQPPMTSQFVFSNAGLQHCSIQEPDHCLFGVRHQIRESKVIFRNEEIEFGGSLYQPANRGCYPSVAIAHGSEESDRYALDPLPQILAANGIAVLTYDKRGTGVSGGDWQSAGIEDLAGDLNAAIEQVLIGERETNSRAIGLLGFSEGGWSCLGPLLTDQLHS